VTRSQVGIPLVGTKEFDSMVTGKTSGVIRSAVDSFSALPNGEDHRPDDLARHVPQLGQVALHDGPAVAQ
jgi:hypothetical protein